MRRLLGMLRDDDEEQSRAPQPSLERARRRSPRRCARRACRSSSTVEGVPNGHPAGRRRLRLPDRAGGADERAQARRARRSPASTCATRPTRSRSTVADDGRGGLHRRRDRQRARSASRSGSRSSAARSRPGRSPTAASPSTRGCRTGTTRDPGPARRRPGARPHRLPADPLGRADIEVVGEAGDGAEAATLAAELAAGRRADGRPHAGASTGSRRRAAIVVDETSPRVLVLTTFDLDDIVYDALRAGASGFLLKDAPEERLLTAIQVVAEGGSLFAPSVTRRLIDEFSRRAPTAPPPALAELTARELEVLRLARAGPLERRDRRAPRRQRAHGEDARRPDPAEARPA